MIPSTDATRRYVHRTVIGPLMGGVGEVEEAMEAE